MTLAIINSIELVDNYSIYEVTVRVAPPWKQHLFCRSGNQVITATRLEVTAARI